MRVLAVMVAAMLIAGCTPHREVPAGMVRYDTPENGAQLARVVGNLALANVDLCRGSPIGTMPHPTTGREVCAFSVTMIVGGTVNAFTDGTSIGVTQGMMAFVRTDDELAIILGHEVGHILREHVQETALVSIVGAVVDGFVAGRGGNTGGFFQQAAGRAFNPDREREADRWGMYMAARAGYDAQAAVALWRRMPYNPGGFLQSHPASENRLSHVSTVAFEIRRAQLWDQPLTP